MAHKTLAIIAALSVAGLLFLVYLALTFESPEGTRTVDIEQPVPRPAEPVRPVDRPDEDEEPEDTGLALIEVTPPAPEEPEEPAEPEEPIEELPPLNESDSFVLSRLANMELGASLLRLVTPDDLVRSFVVFADNAARDQLPQMGYPLRPVEEEMPVREVDDNLFVMEPEAHRRFDQMVDVLVSLDVREAMRIYRAMRPLFEDAYAELGYGDRDFDETLISAIDTVLDAPTMEGPFQLIQPSVMYQFAEAEIEEMSPLEKQLIRLGPENTERLKEQLREYRRHLVAQP